MLCTSRGQSPEEVAALLLQIAENPEPDMRYQTTNDMTRYIAERMVDPTGNTAKEGNIKFVNRLIKSANKEK